MRQPADPRNSAKRETVLCFAWLRQMETPCPALSDAYQRLADAVVQAEGPDLATVILDWLEGELKAAREAGEEAGRRGAQLMKAAVALSSALRQ